MHFRNHQGLGDYGPSEIKEAREAVEGAIGKGQAPPSRY